MKEKKKKLRCKYPENIIVFKKCETQVSINRILRT